jgi:hypothetical protein
VRAGYAFSTAVLHLASTRRAEAATLVQVSDHQSKLIERDGQPQRRRLLDRQFVVRSTDVLCEGVSCDDDPGAAILLEPTHRSQLGLQPAVVALDAVVGTLVGTTPCRGQQRLQHRRVRRGPIGCDLDWSNSCSAGGLLEEPLGGVSVSSGGHEHVDDLAELVDRAVHVAPLPATFR